uniref:Uncharacterized protein n=1 Tax=Parascaris equorum TaxID=6256 RepID=A0A914RUC4_PAREQ
MIQVKSHTIANGHHADGNSRGVTNSLGIIASTPALSLSHVGLVYEPLHVLTIFR